MDTKPPGNRLDLLVDKNAKLSAQVEVQRAELRRLETKLAEVEAREDERHEVLLCVNRLWDELHSAIAFLQYRASGVAGQHQQQQENTEARDADLLQQSDPFLAKLLSTFLPGDKRAAELAASLSDDVGEVESALRKRMEATLHAATGVLELVERLKQQRPEGEGGASKGGANNGGSGEAQLVAMSNLLRAENNRLRDQALQDSHKIRQLQNSLAGEYREDELLVAQRKIAQLKPSPAAPSSAAGGALLAATPGPTSAASNSAAGEDAVLLRRMLEKRAAELEEREAALLRAERESRDLRDRLASEREGAARTRQYEQERLRHTHAELDKMAGRLREVARERDALGLRLRQLEFQADKGAQAMHELQEAGAYVRELEGRLASLQAAHCEAEVAVQASLVALQRDLASARASAAKYHAASEGAAAARRQAEASTTAAAARAAELSVMERRVQELRAAVVAVASKERQWKERERDMHMFIQINRTFMRDPRQLTELRASEARLKECVAELQRQLSGHPLKVELAAAQRREAELQTQVDSLLRERARLKVECDALQRHVAASQKEVEDARAEAEAFLEQLESTGGAYEEQRDRNLRLEESLVARDADISRLRLVQGKGERVVEEATVAAQERRASEEGREAAAAAARRSEDAAAMLRQRVAELEAKSQVLLDELDRAKRDVRALAAQCEEAKQEAAEREALIDAHKAEAETVRQEAAARARERNEESEKLRREQGRVARLQEELQTVQARVERLQRLESSPSGKDRELQRETEALRKMVNCNVCHQRQKDVIITKCWHMFCNHCIKRNLESRHRKCPGCGISFGAGDVQHFYFT
eukprot:scaffold27.g5997.t1